MHIVCIHMTLDSLSRVPSSERLSGSLVHVRPDVFAAGQGGHDLRRFVSVSSRLIKAVPGLVWACLGLSGLVWACLDLSGLVWACLGLSPCPGVCLGLSGLVWACLGMPPSGLRCFLWAALARARTRRPSSRAEQCRQCKHEGSGARGAVVCNFHVGVREYPQQRSVVSPRGRGLAVLGVDRESIG